jgi:DNA-binding protein HU-beta
MATRQVTRSIKKTPAGTAKATNKAKAASSASAVRRAQTRTAVNPGEARIYRAQDANPSVASTGKAATLTTKPASMTGPLPATVTLKHLAEWAGYNHGVPKKQVTEMFTGFVEDIGRILKKGSKIRIPNFGILQVRVRPARPARTGRNPRTGEEVRIKASRASKKVAFRVAKSLKEAI